MCSTHDQITSKSTLQSSVAAVDSFSRNTNRLQLLRSLILLKAAWTGEILLRPSQEENQNSAPYWLVWRWVFTRSTRQAEKLHMAQITTNMHSGHTLWMHNVQHWSDILLLLGLVSGPQGLSTAAATLTSPQHTHKHTISESNIEQTLLRGSISIAFLCYTYY